MQNGQRFKKKRSISTGNCKSKIFVVRGRSIVILTFLNITR